MKSPIILRIFKNNQLVEVKQFDTDQVIFGHDADVTVDLNDESISSIHCLIELRDSGYYLCDMGSATGTKKNGNAILDESISSGDNIEIGPFRIQFFVGAPKPKTEPVITAPATVPQASTQTQAPPAAPTQEAPPQAQTPVATPPPPPAPTQAAPPPPPPAPKEQKKPASIPAAPVVPQSNEPAATKKESPIKPVQQTVKPRPPQTPPTPQAPTVRPPKLPEKSNSSSGIHAKHKKGTPTFAPASEIKDLSTYLKPTKGPVVEVIVAWQERVLATYHYSADQIVTIGSSKKAEISIPSNFIQGAVPFLELKGGCRVLAPADMTVEITNSSQSRFGLDDLMKSGKSVKSGTANAVRLDQGELLCLRGLGGVVQIYVRYVPATIRPILAAPLDFSAGELTGLVVSLVIVALTALYMSVYTPPVVEEKPEEQVRLAQFIYNKPPTTTTQPAVREPTPPPPKEVEAKPPPPPEKKVVKLSDEKKEVVNKGNKESKAAVKQTEAAKAADVRPMPSTNRPKKFTSIKQGGATKIGDTAGANAQSAKDVTKVGLLSAFGGGGVRKQLDQAYSGSGELLGMANEATGKSGQNEDRAGDDIGSKFKDTGAGGKGTATQGIAGINTKGRGSGMSSYGSGVGLGGKGSVTVDPGGAEEGWDGTIDREAVRRVIKSILNQIKSCYERQLRVNSSLEGKIVIQFEIMDQGIVRTAKTKSTTLNDSTVESCVASRIKAAKFPEPPQGVIAVVDYPFVFGAQK